MGPGFAADPLGWAVEQAWAAGITVVAAAGNDGDGVVTAPGRDPWVITVGATDHRGTATTVDDTVPDWSGSGRVGPVAKPELLAPGVAVTSLRAPASTIDLAHPGARIGDDNFRGSGTSMAAALTAGVVATLTARHPEATPDDLKTALVVAADDVVGEIGGAVDTSEAETVDEDAVQRWREAHRAHSGDATEWQGTRWSGTRWSGTRWSGTRWSGTRWSGTRWSGTRWSGTRWTGTRWTGTRWTGTRWTGNAWTGNAWTDASWGDAPT
jgi:serine protease AprX